MLQRTTALTKISKLRKPIRVIRGGQGSGKTFSILTLIINHASSKPNKRIFIISAELTKMRDTVILDFIAIMKEAGIYDQNRFLDNRLYKYPNGSFIKFIGLDKEDVGKGLRSDVAFFNEVNKVPFDSYDQVASRAGIVYADYNPDAEFFIDTDVLIRPDACFLQLTFEDNELLSERERFNILQYFEKGYNKDGTIKNKFYANKWQVYGLGNIGSINGAVFENWEIIQEIPKEAELIAYGLDWGFTNDPTGLVAVYKWNKDIVIDELIYQTGLTNSMLVERMKALNIDKYVDIIADSSEPKSIQDLRNLGYGNTMPAKKGSDSVVFGINKMQEYKIWITSRSKNAINEFRNYTWATDRNGKATGQPIDNHNHLIDPTRYVTLNKLQSGYFEML